MAHPEHPLEVTVAEAHALVTAHPDQVRIIDVREPDELEICRLPGADHIPMRQIPAQVATLPHDRHLLVLCHHGSRSLQVTRFLRAQGFKAVSSIDGGIDAWAGEFDPAMRRY
jgi:sulfur-carrier protein adenylyltransferase/sulfurtransferase